jgi:effector-binding domain-containing protein
MTAPALAVDRVSVSQSPPRHVLSRHVTVDEADLPSTLGTTFAEIYAHLGTTHVEPDGPPFVVYHDSSEPGVRWEIDICAPIASPVAPPPGLEYNELPGGRVCSLLHAGPYSTLGAAYAQIERYLARNRLTRAGPPREFYLSEAEVPPEEIMTLLEQPIA